MLLLLGMISMAAGQVLLRNFFDGGVYWGDSAVRVMVLWVTMLGAMVASRDDSHIRIDLVGRFLKDLGKAVAGGDRCTHQLRLYLCSPRALLLGEWALCLLRIFGWQHCLCQGARLDL